MDTLENWSHFEWALDSHGHRHESICWVNALSTVAQILWITAYGMVKWVALTLWSPNGMQMMFCGSRYLCDDTILFQQSDGIRPPLMTPEITASWVWLRSPPDKQFRNFFQFQYTDIGFTITMHASLSAMEKQTEIDSSAERWNRSSHSPFVEQVNVCHSTDICGTLLNFRCVSTLHPSDTHFNFWFVTFYCNPHLQIPMLLRGRSTSNILVLAGMWLLSPRQFS